VEVALLDFGLFLVRHGWGMAFTSAPPVIAYVTQFVPVALVAILMDSMIGVLSGQFENSMLPSPSCSTLVLCCHPHGLHDPSALRSASSPPHSPCSPCVPPFPLCCAGVVRGCGFQHHAVVANLISYYLIGVPLAMLLGFYCDLRAWDSSWASWWG